MKLPWISRTEHDRILVEQRADAIRREAVVSESAGKEIAALSEIIRQAKLYSTTVGRNPEDTHLYTVKVMFSAEMMHWAMDGKTGAARHIAGDVAHRVQRELEHMCGYDRILARKP
jgi:hypothetical protein